MAASMKSIATSVLSSECNRGHITSALTTFFFVIVLLTLFLVIVDSPTAADNGGCSVIMFQRPVYHW